MIEVRLLKFDAYTSPRTFADWSLQETFYAVNYFSFKYVTLRFVGNFDWHFLAHCVLITHEARVEA
jgi:hypothetical protein